MEGCSRDATGHVASMQLGKGDAASAQRLTDTGGERQGGELGHPVHTNLHTNLHHLHTRAHEARPPEAGSDRWLSKRRCSAIHRCALSLGGARRACTVRVLLEGLHVHPHPDHLQMASLHAVPYMYMNSRYFGLSCLHLSHIAVAA